MKNTKGKYIATGAVDFGNLFQILSGSDFSEKLEKSLSETSDMDIISETASAYVQLAKRLSGHFKPMSIILDLDDPMLFSVDGVKYDCDLCVRHSMKKETELKCQIEALIADGGGLASVQNKINEMILKLNQR